MLPEIDQTEAASIAERLRQEIASLTVDSTKYGRLKVTASFGTATLIPNPNRTIPTDPKSQQRILEELVSRAGQALHTAKQFGRNQVAVYPAAGP